MALGRVKGGGGDPTTELGSTKSLILDPGVAGAFGVLGLFEADFDPLLLDLGFLFK